jgi:hypothetical protein
LGLASLPLLVSWEIWNERSTRVFRNKQVPPLVIIDKIKNKARLWVIAGVNRLGDLLLEE